MLADDGTQIGSVESDGKELTFAFTDRDVQRYPITDVGNYGVKLPDGQEVVFAFDGMALTYVGASTAGAGDRVCRPSHCPCGAILAFGKRDVGGSRWAARILRGSWRISPSIFIPTR